MTPGRHHDMESTVDTLLRALQKLPRHRGLSFRGMETSEPPLRTGELIVSPSLVATSLDPRIATENFRSNRLLAVFGPDGRVLGPHSQHPHEHEVVFLPSSVFKVVETSDVGGIPVTIIEQLDLESRGTGPWAGLDKIRELIAAHVPRARQRSDVHVSSPGKFVGGLAAHQPEHLDLDILAAEMRSMGYGEYVDFYIANRADGTLPSSELVCLSFRDGAYRVWYRDMGRDHELLTTDDPAEARRIFLDETQTLVDARYGSRRRREARPKEPATGPVADLRRDLEAAGVGADAVMWEDEDWKRHDGVWVLRAS
jgi:hypothetical protein